MNKNCLIYLAVIWPALCAAAPVAPSEQNPERMQEIQNRSETAPAEEALPVKIAVIQDKLKNPKLSLKRRAKLEKELARLKANRPY